MSNSVYEEWKLVYTCSQEMEADMLESFLNNEGIDTLRKYPGFSDIVRIVGGMTSLGVNIYVRESRVEEAKNIIRDINKSLEDDQ